MTCDVLIVGAGLAGLNCAVHLQRAGKKVLLLEAADAVGGRVRTDVLDGFLLDRGFQVLLTSYPAAQQAFDMKGLQLAPFRAGAIIRQGGAFHHLADPWRELGTAVRNVFSPVAPFWDKVRVGKLRTACLRGTIDERWHDTETTTLAALQSFGFSPTMIDRFFRPFLGGVFLEPDLQTSSRMFQFVFRMFATGDACLPATGMQALPLQLAAQLPPEAIMLRTAVARVTPGAVQLADGRTLTAPHIVVAVEGPAVARLMGEVTPTANGQGVTCLYFAAETPPLREPILVLNGEGRGPVNNLCVPTNVCSSYGPAGQSLISATVLGIPSTGTLEADVRQQMTEWFGPRVATWRHLRTYAIPYALPRQVPPALDPYERPIEHAPGLYVCGDHRDQASIQGALASGRRTAETIRNALR